MGTATLSSIPIAQGWVRFGNGAGDELCIRNNFNAKPNSALLRSVAAVLFAQQLLPAPTAGKCDKRRLQTEVCGSFGVKNGALTFDVTSAKAHMKDYRARPVCNAAADKIEEEAVKLLQQDTGEAIVNQFKVAASSERGENF